MNKQNNIIDSNNDKSQYIDKREVIKKYYVNLCNNNDYLGTKLFICLVLSSMLSVSIIFSFMKVGFSYRDEKIVEIQNQLDVYKSKIQTITTSLDTVTSDLDTIKNDIKSSKESSSNSLVRIANLLKDVQLIKNALNITTESPANTKEEDLNKLSSENREFIESFENLIKDGVPFNDFIEKIDTTKYKSINNLLEFKDKNVKSVDSLKKDFTAIGSSVFGNQVKESFWQKQFRIFKEKISNAIKIESSNGTLQTLGSDLDDKGLFENAQNSVNNNKLEEAYALLKKIKSSNENITTLKSDLSNRIELNKAFAQFKIEFMEVETNS